MNGVSQWIDGENVAGAGRQMDIINPATAQTIGVLTEASPEQVDRAVTAARRSFDTGTWANAPMNERRSFMRRAAEAIRENLDELTKLQVAEGGMLPASVRGQIAGAAGWFDYFADFLTLESGESYRQLGDAIALVEREPIGVCALYTPWNVPVTLTAIKMAPALAAGNSVVLKPSEETPLVTRKLVDLVQQAGLPKGVLNYVNGRGAVTGAALSEHPGIDMVSFTGGHVGGEAVAVAAARRHLPCVMELGGKSATIVFDDADLEAAVDGAIGAIYGSNGEACLAGSRIIIQSGIRDAFLAAFHERATSLIVGAPEADETYLGPMISAAHQKRVLGFYDSAKTDGDTVLFGGPTPNQGAGFFVAPGAIEVASSSSRVWREEVFGPLAAMASFEDEDEAIAMANDSQFGLAGYVWTRDIERALRVTKRVRTGTILVNSGFRRELNAPFGGLKNSGIGREGGAHSWMNFTEAKTIILNQGNL